MSPLEVAATVSVDEAARTLRWSPSTGRDRQVELTDLVGVVRSPTSSTSEYRVLYIDRNSANNSPNGVNVQTALRCLGVRHCGRFPRLFIVFGQQDTATVGH